jgi:LysR family glycine cleavage system transcriptional activator
MDFRKLPNLGAVRALEAAARRQSFSRAAEELFVTHSAISHQIRALEAELGTKLFRREGKRLELTEAGRRYADQVRSALMSIAIATDQVRSGGRERRLVISLLPSFAARWLMPRIGRFIERYPELDVELQSTHVVTDFNRDDVDVVLRRATARGSLLSRLRADL